MKGLILPIAAGALLITTVSSAQWFEQRSPDIPRLADGTADLNAPTPRTAAGTPDLSGLWALEVDRDPGLLGQPYGLAFLNIGASLEDGLPYQDWAAERVQANLDNNRANDPVSHCLPYGPIRMHTTTLYRRMFQLSDRLLILSETDNSYRQLFTDGRPLPDDPDPSLYGYSSGSWEGDTLVIKTIGFHYGLWLDNQGSPLTDVAKVTEKFRRPRFGQLEIELTVDDPQAYTEPWTVTLHQILIPDTELGEAICAEQEMVELMGTDHKQSGSLISH